MSFMQEELDKLVKAIVSGDMEDSQKIIEGLMKSGVTFKDVIVEGVMRGVGKMGELLDEGEISLFELVDCVKTTHVILDTIGKFVKRPEVPLGRVVIGVVEGDTHAIGKDIVAAMLSYSGFEVHNLGEKVSPRVYVEKAKEVNTDIVALSTCLDATMPKMKETIDALAEAGIRDKVKILVGGRPVTPESTKEIGADAYGKDPLEAVEVGKRMIEELLRAKA